MYNDRICDGWYKHLNIITEVIIIWIWTIALFQVRTMFFRVNLTFEFMIVFFRSHEPLSLWHLSCHPYFVSFLQVQLLQYRCMPSHQTYHKCSSKSLVEVLFLFRTIQNPRWPPLPQIRRDIGVRHDFSMLLKKCFYISERFEI
jgi:hypothetical protein